LRNKINAGETRRRTKIELRSHIFCREGKAGLGAYYASEIEGGYRKKTRPFGVGKEDLAALAKSLLINRKNSRGKKSPERPRKAVRSDARGKNERRHGD